MCVLTGGVNLGGFWINLEIGGSRWPPFRKHGHVTTSSLWGLVGERTVEYHTTPKFHFHSCNTVDVSGKGWGGTSVSPYHTPPTPHTPIYFYGQSDARKTNVVELVKYD